MGRLLRMQSHPAPAKINLFLAITGRRPDAFHNLVSVAAPLTWGDLIEAEPVAGPSTVSCDQPGVPTDGSNLVLKAAAAFAVATGWQQGVHFTIRKKIPFGAGLGGASTDAVAALRAMNGLSGGLLDREGLLQAAAAVGSDCPLFLAPGPVIMRGRGERIEPLPREAYGRIRGMRVLVFKPGFAVPTPWAYGRLAAEGPKSYVTLAGAEARLSAWLERAGEPIDSLLYNTMERPVFAKFPAVPLLLEQIRGRFGLAPRMSGSGSACFALLHEDVDAGPVEAQIRESWGPSAFVVETRLA